MIRLPEKAPKIERTALKATEWIGSTQSIVVHTIVFVVAFTLPFLGVPLDRVLLVLTTAVSLEAIYLAIFIQMTVNKNTEDIEEIQEDLEEIEHDVDEIQKDVDEIQEDIEDIEEDQEEEIKRDTEMIKKIEGSLTELMKELKSIKENRN